MKRIKICYRDRYISSDKTEARDFPRVLFADYTWTDGGLTYCKINQFDYRTIETYLIDSIEGVER